MHRAHDVGDLGAGGRMRRIRLDDQTALEHGALIYEALYAQLASEAL